MNAALATEKPPPTNAVSGKMKIRDARETDLPAIIKIYNAAIATRISTAQLEPVTLQERHDWLKDHSPNRHPFWVLEINHNVVGGLNAEIISAARCLSRHRRSQCLRRRKIPATRSWSRITCRSNQPGTDTRHQRHGWTDFREQQREPAIV